MRFSIVAVLATAASTVTAFTCGASTSPALNPYCCETASNYPRGYVGSNCVNATASAPKKCSTSTTDYSCPNTAKPVAICCQQLEALGTNPSPVAYYCGQPIGQ